RRDSPGDWNREGAVAGTDVGDQRTWLRPKKPDDGCNAVLPLELRTGLLRHGDGGRDGDQDDARNACKVTEQGLHRVRAVSNIRSRAHRTHTSADPCHVW